VHARSEAATVAVKPLQGASEFGIFLQDTDLIPVPAEDGAALQPAQPAAYDNNVIFCIHDHLVCPQKDRKNGPFRLKTKNSKRIKGKSDDGAFIDFVKNQGK
jgi:hypothetical protein